MAIDTSKKGQGMVWIPKSSNPTLMQKVFDTCGIKPIKGRLVFATHSFHKAIVWCKLDKDNSFDNLVSNFKSIMGINK